MYVCKLTTLLCVCPIMEIKVLLASLIIHTILFYALLKALLPVCMKYTALGVSRVANIAKGECYICHETLTKSCILSYK